MPWLLLMGLRHVILSAAPLLLATAALAQEDSGAPPVFNLPGAPSQGNQPERQGPELDVFRGSPTPVTPPPAVAPTVAPPLVVAPPPQAAQPQPTSPRADQPASRPAAPTPSPAAPAAEEAPAPPPTAETAQPSLPPQQEAASPAAPAPAPMPEQGAPDWLWIAVAAAALSALIVAFLLLRRRSHDVEEDDAFEAVPDEAEVTPPPPPAPAAPRPAPPPAPQSNTDRPWIDISMEVKAARLSLMGATIGYTLTLHNRGSQAAEDILVRNIIANADAGQQAMLQQFFGGATGLPVHSMVSLRAGESQSLTGELRLLLDQITPVQMGGRAMLIPLVAFDAQYRWMAGDGEPAGTGRTGRAFLIGQEQSPPAERLSPFRLDLGPRQYRAPGSRATALSLAS